MHGVLDRAGSDYLSRLRGSPCCLPHCLTASAPWINGFSRLNSPARMPLVNASQTSLRTPAHDSGSMWFAIPSSYETFTHYLSPVLTGATKHAMVSDPGEASISLPLSSMLVLTSTTLKVLSFSSRHLRGSIPFNLSAYGLSARCPTLKV